MAFATTASVAILAAVRHVQESQESKDPGGRGKSSVQRFLYPITFRRSGR